MAMNKIGMYSEVELTKDEADTAVESSRSPTLPLIPLMTLRRQPIAPPSVWTSLRIWAAVKFARLAAWMAP